MALEECAGGCGRSISISISEEGNPFAMINPEHFAVDYRLCPYCLVYLCDSCWQKTKKCPNCGREMLVGKPQKEAAVRMGILNIFQDIGQDEEVNKRAEALIAKHLSCLRDKNARKKMEPGVHEGTAEYTASVCQQIEEICHAAGQKIDAEKVNDLVIYSNYLGVVLIEAMGLVQPVGVLNLNGDCISSFIEMQSYCMYKSSHLIPEQRPCAFERLAQQRPEMNVVIHGIITSLTGSVELAAESRALEMLDNMFGSSTLYGVFLGIAQELARSEATIGREGRDDDVFRFWGEHLIEQAEMYDEGAIDFFDVRRMDAYLVRLQENCSPDWDRRISITRRQLAKYLDAQH